MTMLERCAGAIHRNRMQFTTIAIFVVGGWLRVFGAEAWGVVLICFWAAHLAGTVDQALKDHQ